MPNASARYVCQSCGSASARWAGKCEECGAWNSIVEEAPRENLPRGLGAKKGRGLTLTPLDADAPLASHRPTGNAEFDRVLGGGLVAGSAILIGGDPGIGKSTLLLQIVASLGKQSPPMKSVYVSGEEAVEQIQLRARRLGLSANAAKLAAATSLRDIVAGLEREAEVGLVVIDSVQTMYLDNLDSAPGTVAQVRGSAAELVRLAKQRGFVLVLVGHVTKDGQIAGPRVLEHMVDTVLYFEGERGHQFRLLRAVKNRFGPANEIGVFEMTDCGLAEIANPSSLFLRERRGNVTGAAVFAGMEGTRPVLVEIQALVSPSPLATPRRAVVGWDANRLAMILAVLEARCGLAFTGQEVYLNIAGGLRIAEPAADLAVALALVSALTGNPVPFDAVAFGEIGLSGEIRRVSQAEARRREAGKLGFARIIEPSGGEGSQVPERERETVLLEMAHLRDVIEWLDECSVAAAPNEGRVGKG
jgi:DNA repair protein RadA/Sms